MISRRDVVTDSAIAVVAEQGVRGLTHRAVDALAELPVGSTSNVYRTRDALITGIMERIGELNSQQLERIPELVRAPGADSLEVAIDFCMNWLTTDRNRFYTMMMLSLDPALPPEAVIAKEKNVRAIHDFIMRLAGVDADCARHINSSVAGMMFSELVSGTADRANVETYLREFFSWLDNVRASA
ncbi:MULTISPECIES: TetR family transcriptional regulator [unclassified Brevibacterium]|jgi:AcrR family transcriptional regulator|uniref:TetR/AcrR family transcriptional regulator n=1 Tax=unclassified Brevibacterium TaxID=2614124 RepID=UPI001BA6EEA3|nr:MULTISPECIES: TetR family transcriptional regulator [unclassified Brevibacterium]QUL80930.1 TetR family transcriptional regulator [Brevibacterium sp. SMBL_HHYL_HB1]HJA62152.1 TetR family transcriptional regulator [Candidatus Brevibacterium intestinavium]